MKLTFQVCIICACVTCLFANKAMAQQSANRFSVQISVGAALPVGKFGKKSLSYNPDSSYGLAKAGPIANIKVGYGLSEKLSLSLLVSGMINREDKESFESGSFQTANAWSSISVHSWKTFSVMAGTNFDLHAGDHGLIVSPSVHAGVVKSGFPGDTAVYHSDVQGSLDDHPFAIWRDKFPLRWTFCYQAGVSIQYPLNNRLYLDGTAAFFNTAGLRSAKFDNDPRRFKISTINITAGVRLLL